MKFVVLTRFIAEPLVYSSLANRVVKLNSLFEMRYGLYSNMDFRLIIITVPGTVVLPTCTTDTRENIQLSNLLGVVLW